MDYFVGVQYDISEEKEAEQSFQLRKEALGSCTEGVVISDPSQPDNPIIYCSNSFLRITGYSMDEVIGRNCRFLQGPGTDEDTLNCIREAIAKQTQVYICIYIKGEGVIIAVDTAAISFCLLSFLKRVLLLNFEL